MIHVPLARRFAVWGDHLLGYDTPDPKTKWWLDLEDVNGVLEIPKYAGDRTDNKSQKR